MNSQSFYFFSLLTLCSSLILIHVPRGSSNPDEFYQLCGKRYTCGNISGLDYPFISVNDPPFCGYPGFVLNCNQDGSTTMAIENFNYRILNVHPTTQTMRIMREDTIESTCPVDLVNTTLDYSLFDYASGYMNLTFLYNCPETSNYAEMYGTVTCRNSRYQNVFVHPGAVGPGNCNASVTVPVPQMSAGTVGSLNSSGLGQVLQQGFDIRWKLDNDACSNCTEEKGRCGYDEYLKQTTCFCPGPPYQSASCSIAAFGFPPPLPLSTPSPSPDDEQFSRCGEPLRCGNMDIDYPFWGEDRPNYCGGHSSFEIKCENDIPKIDFESTKYKVIGIHSPSNILTLARDDLLSNNICLDRPENDSLDLKTFSYVSSDQNITLYFRCSRLGGFQMPTSYQFTCSGNLFGIYTLVGAGFDLTSVTCQNQIIVRVNRTNAEALASAAASEQLLKTAIAGGFSVSWMASIDSKCPKCVMSGGTCGSYSSFTAFACHCADGTHPTDCNDGQNQVNGKKSQKPLTVGLSVGGAVLASIGIGWLFFFCRQKRKRIASQASPAQTEVKDLPILSSSNGLTSSSTPSSTNFTRSITSYPSSKSEADYGRGSSYFGAHVFSFAELEEATNNFDQSKELGDGGFGVVYYGKLHDGRLVAVKRLYEHNFKRVEQFMNEVEILTQLRHKNLVMLYGCTSKRSRDLLLVYEYIPNGTVADHLHGKRAKSGLLSWPIRMNIAIETADALAYLHSSVIIHRDVKTNNILLDNDFHVKVADFGLSRLFPNNVTHVSTAPQGTPGYVDPEYYQCYHLTEKSDVYSFGVVLVELISSLEAVDTNRHRHDINLANMAINKIQSRSIHELVDTSLGFSTNSSVRRMITSVAELAFRCLQQERDLRPSMQEVLETLRGIQNGESKAHNAEVLDIVVDDVGLLKGPFSSSE